LRKVNLTYELINEIIISDNEDKPQVPIKIKGKIEYPVGKIYGTYFSEEIKS